MLLTGLVDLRSYILGRERREAEEFEVACMWVPSTVSDSVWVRRRDAACRDSFYLTGYRSACLREAILGCMRHVARGQKAPCQASAWQTLFHQIVPWQLPPGLPIETCVLFLLSHPRRVTSPRGTPSDSRRGRQAPPTQPGRGSPHHGPLLGGRASNPLLFGSPADVRPRALCACLHLRCSAGMEGVFIHLFSFGSNICFCDTTQRSNHK